MNLFGHTMSSNALNFIDHYSKFLSKELRYVALGDGCAQWGAFDNAENFFVLGIKPNMPDIAFEATFCHELYHAYQFSVGFPTVIAIDRNKQDVMKYTENLRSNILDLSADDAVRKHHLDDSLVMKNRYKQLKHLSYTNFSQIIGQFEKDLLSIDLILDFHSITDNQKSLILQNLKQVLPDVYMQYDIYQKKIDEYGYKTPQGCLNIFGFIINDINLWPHCHIGYNGNKVHNLLQVKKATSSALS